MAVSRALRRLLRIREIEEEQQRMALDAAMDQLNRLNHALAAAAERDRRGRRLADHGTRSGDLWDRLAGMEEMRAAERIATALSSRMAEAETEVAREREAFLVKRIERRQAETLIEEHTARDAIDAGRRSQQDLDDNYRFRQRENASAAETRGNGSLEPSLPITKRIVEKS